MCYDIRTQHENISVAYYFWQFIEHENSWLQLKVIDCVKKCDKYAAQHKIKILTIQLKSKIT